MAKRYKTPQGRAIERRRDQEAAESYQKGKKQFMRDVRKAEEEFKERNQSDDCK